MKKSAFITLFTFIASIAMHAQTAQPVYSIVKQLKSFNWYVEQASLWQEQIKEDSTNAKAWYNYYIANRMANLTGKPEKWKSNKQDVLMGLSDIIDGMKSSIPETFEYNHAVWWNGGNNEELAPFLFKAMEIDPNRVELFSDIITYYELKNNYEQVKHYSKLWFESGDCSPGIMTANYNMLMSTENNAIIFVHGDNDTYPKWIQQYANGIRTDVAVLNISLLFKDEYMRNILKKYEIPVFDQSIGDYYKEHASSSEEGADLTRAYQVELLNHIIKNAGNRPVYFASSMSHHIYDTFAEHLYVEGLAFRYSEERYDNIAYLKKNIEQRFHLDYLTSDYIYDMSQSVVDHFNMSYMIPFNTLYEHYKIAGDEAKALWIRNIMLAVADKVGKTEEIKAQLDAE